MKSQVISGVLLSCLSFSLLAKATNPLCVGVTGSAFTSGNGTQANPYLVCNQSQLAQIGTNPTLLSQSFILGADLSFASTNFSMLGSQNNPFKGTFNGNGYALSAVKIAGISTNYNWIGVFPHLVGATVSNLFINGLTINGILGYNIGGLAGTAENSTVTNVHINQMDMGAPDQSGGLIGYCQSCTISNSSTQGIMRQTFGTDASGGLLGISVDTQIARSASHVDLVQANTTAFGVSAVGGLVGFLMRGSITDSYADGKIDYSAVTDILSIKPHQFGGILGNGGDAIFKNVYCVNKFILSNADEVGGAAGAYGGASSGNIFWDINVSGLTQSAIGTGQTTCLMKQKSFWISQGFDTTVWKLADGSYPKLFSEG